MTFITKPREQRGSSDEPRIVMATIRKVKSRSKKTPGAVRFQAIIRRKGVNLTKTFSTRTEAKAWALIKETDVETGNIHTLNVNEAGEKSISSLLDTYEDEVAADKKCYLKSEKYTIGRLRAAPFAGYSYNELSHQHIVDYGSVRLKEIAGSSFVRELSPLSDMLEHAWQIWGLPRRPNAVRDGIKILRKRGLIKKAAPRDRRLTDGEMDALYLELKTKNPRILDILLFGVETGMRRGEICKLKWKDFDAERGCLVLPDEITKSNVARRIPLTLRASLILNATKKPRGSNSNTLIFGYPDPNAVGKAFRRAVQRCGIEDLRFHDLRHEAISRWIRDGLSLAEVRYISGHKNLASLNPYANPTYEEVQGKLLDMEKHRAEKAGEDTLH